MESSLLFQFSILLGITVTIAAVMRLLRQPLVVAYIVAGIFAGPLFLNLVSNGKETFETFSQFGVILLLFVVGLSLNVSHLKHIARVSIRTGFVQALFTGIGGYLLLRALGSPVSEAIYLGIALIFSSTIVVGNILSAKRDLESTYGRAVLGLMVVQDIIAAMVLLAINSFESGAPLADAAGLLAIKGLLLCLFIYFLARVVLPFVLDHVARSNEFLFLFTVSWCFGVASAVYWGGFSIEIGALAAGISLGSSPYQPEIASRVKPLKDFFLVLFFILLGSEMSSVDIGSTLFPAAIISLFVIIGNPFILYHVYRFQKFSRRNSFLAAVSAAQVSEFGFILLITGANQGRLGDGALALFTMVALVTIVISSYAITYNEQLYKLLMPVFRLFGPDRHVSREPTKVRYDAIVFGYHRVGWKVCEAIIAKQISFAVVDFNPEAILKLKSRGIPCYFGDAADTEFLASLPIDRVRIVISTIPAVDDERTLIRHVKSVSRSAKIIATLYAGGDLKDLYAAGADYVMMPHLLGGHYIASLLTHKPWTERTFAALRREQEGEMRLRYLHNPNKSFT